MQGSTNGPTLKMGTTMLTRGASAFDAVEIISLERTSQIQGIQVLPQLFLPVGHVEADRLEPGKVERGVDRARGDGALGARVVVGGRYRHDPVPVALAASKTARAISAQDLTVPEPVQS